MKPITLTLALLALAAPIARPAEKKENPDASNCWPMLARHEPSGRDSPVSRLTSRSTSRERFTRAKWT
jgi:hypothetical protein